jgi:hypothetical protein
MVGTREPHGCSSVIFPYQAPTTAPTAAPTLAPSSSPTTHPTKVSMRSCGGGRRLDFKLVCASGSDDVPIGHADDDAHLVTDTCAHRGEGEGVRGKGGKGRGR